MVYDLGPSEQIRAAFVRCMDHPAVPSGRCGSKNRNGRTGTPQPCAPDSQHFRWSKGRRPPPTITPPLPGADTESSDYPGSSCHHGDSPLGLRTTARGYGYTAKHRAHMERIAYPSIPGVALLYRLDYRVLILVYSPLVRSLYRIPSRRSLYRLVDVNLRSCEPARLVEEAAAAGLPIVRSPFGWQSAP